MIQRDILPSRSTLQLGWRQMLADPGYCLVVLLGLAAALAVAALAATIAEAMVVIDRDVPQAERVVTFEFKGNVPGQAEEWLGMAPYVLRDALRSSGAPLLAVARTTGDPRFSLRSGERVLSTRLLLADPEITAIFGLRALQGDLAATLARPDAVALTPETAERLFGTRAAIGRTLRAGGHTLTVGAIVPPRLREHSVLPYEVIAGMASAIAPQAGSQQLSSWFDFNGRIYARLAPGASAEHVGALAQALFDASPAVREAPAAWVAGGRKVALLRAMPLSRHALHGAGSPGRRLQLGVLGVAAVLMLLLAAVNYVNLTSVRTLRRQREIGIRKALGASPAALVLQFIAESVSVALLAGVLGLLLAWLLTPALAELLQQPLPPGPPPAARIAAMLVGAALLGAATGAYPAWVALRVKTAPSLAGRQQGESQRGRWLRRALTAGQFGAAVALSALSLVVLWQARHAAQMPMGFQSEGLVAVDLPRLSDASAGDRFRDALLRQAGIVGAAAAQDVPGRGWSNSKSTLETPRGTLTVRVATVSPELFAVHRVPLLAGRLDAAMDTEADRRVVIDRAAVTAFGFSDAQAAIGQVVDRDSGHSVVAVVDSVRLENAREPVLPKLFVLRKQTRDALVVRGSDAAAARAAIAAVWPQHYPDVLPRIESVTHYLDANYADERRLGGLIGGAGVLALLLAGCGVYALAAYTVRQRTREIVLRKLHGAGAGAVVGLLVREFGALLAAGCALGLPLAWVASQQFMARFVEQAPVGPWPFVAAPLVALALAALATLRHATTALGLRPALALRG